MSLDISSLLPADPSNAAKQALAPVVNDLGGSKILRIASQVRAMQREGKEICNLTVGDFSPAQFRIPEALTRGIVDAVQAGHTNYPPSDGIPELKEAIAEYYADELGLEYSAGSVCVGSGARPPIYAAWRMFVEPGDRTVSCRPMWNVSYYAHLVQSEHVFLETSAETNFFPTVEQVAEVLPGTRLLVLNSPLNPTGTMIDEEVLRGIAQAVVDENKRRTGRPCMLLFDQVYWLLTAEGMEHKSPVQLVPEVAPYVVHVDAVSKAFAGTGLRVGWGVLPEYLQPKMKALIGHMGSWAPRPEQMATAAFLRDRAAVSTYLDSIRSDIAGRLGAFYDGFQDMASRGLPVDAIKPQGAIYMSLHLDLIGRGGKGGAFDTNEQIRSWLLEDAGVAVVPFQAFDLTGDTGWFRLSVGAVGVDECHAAVGRIEDAMKRRGLA